MAQFMYLAGVGATPTVVGVLASHNDFATSHSFSVPGGGTVAGELLLLGCSGTSWSAPAGWSTLLNSGNAAVFYKVASGSEGGTITVTSGSAGPSGASIYRISGYSGAPEAASASSTGTAPDPPSLTPSWAAANTLWIAFAESFVSAVSLSFSSYPSGYSNGVNDTGNSFGVVWAMSASAQLASSATSEDPGAFALTSAGSVVWRAITVAVKPL